MTQYKMIGNKKIPLTEIDLLEIEEKEKKYLIDEIEIQSGQDKIQKRKDILAILSETDQLNLMAQCLEKLSEGNTDPLIVEAKAKFQQIKNILNS